MICKVADLADGSDPIVRRLVSKSLSVLVSDGRQKSTGFVVVEREAGKLRRAGRMGFVALRDFLGTTAVTPTGVRSDAALGYPPSSGALRKYVKERLKALGCSDVAEEESTTKFLVGHIEHFLSLDSSTAERIEVLLCGGRHPVGFAVDGSVVLTESSPLKICLNGEAQWRDFDMVEKRGSLEQYEETLSAFDPRQVPYSQSDAVLFPRSRLDFRRSEPSKSRVEPCEAAEALRLEFWEKECNKQPLTCVCCDVQFHQQDPNFSTTQQMVKHFQSRRHVQSKEAVLLRRG